jgi:hypothetical protein
MTNLEAYANGLMEYSDVYTTFDITTLRKSGMFLKNIIPY